MEDACWSRLFARRVAQSLGYRVSDEPGTSGTIEVDADAQQLIAEVTETFRYLPLDKIQYTVDFAEFLRNKLEAANCHTHPADVLEKFRAFRAFVLFLRERFGKPLPADEKDYWTDEDRRDFQAQAWRRLDEEDPYPWEDKDAFSG